MLFLWCIRGTKHPNSIGALYYAWLFFCLDNAQSPIEVKSFFLILQMLENI